MNLLCFDTVLNKTFINYNGTSRVIKSDAQNYHSVYLISEIRKILGAAGVGAVDAIGVNIGPGSFTGIRVCLTVATVMAGELDIPLVGVPSVEILSEAFGVDAVFLDARRGKYIYYDGDEAKLIDKADALAFTKDTLYEDPALYGSVKLCQRAGEKIVADANCYEYFASEGVEVINYEVKTPNLGAVLAKLAAKKLQAGGDFHYAKVKPLYLQTPPIMVK